MEAQERYKYESAASNFDSVMEWFTSPEIEKYAYVHDNGGLRMAVSKPVYDYMDPELIALNHTVDFWFPKVNFQTVVVAVQWPREAFKVLTGEDVLHGVFSVNFLTLPDVKGGTKLSRGVFDEQGHLHTYLNPENPEESKEFEHTREVGAYYAQAVKRTLQYPKAPRLIHPEFPRHTGELHPVAEIVSRAGGVQEFFRLRL